MSQKWYVHDDDRSFFIEEISDRYIDIVYGDFFDNEHECIRLHCKDIDLLINALQKAKQHYETKKQEAVEQDKLARWEKAKIPCEE